MRKKINIVLMILLVTIVLTACDKKKDTNMCDGVNHQISEWIIDTEATCTTLGSKHQVCELCGKTITTAVIPIISHQLEKDEAVEATCTEKGKTEGSHCTICHEIIVAQEEIPAKGHKYVLNPSLSTTTSFIFECEYCGDVHTETGNIENICLNGHTIGELETVTNSTCTTFGLAHRLCTVCGMELEIEQLPLASHTVVEDHGYDATCTEAGKTSGTHCSVCNTVIEAQVVIDAIGHDYELTASVSPTADKDGYLEYTCNNCHETYQEVIEYNAEYDSTSPTTVVLSDTGIIVTNNNGGVIITENTILINLGGDYTFMGSISEGNIIVQLSEEDEINIDLAGLTLTSTQTHPIYIESGDKVEISAKKDTENFIYDKRKIDASIDTKGAAIYSEIDLTIKGKGNLTIESTYNNGIGTTKDLEIKNLTLSVNCPNNALKGNDSVTIESGTITAISSSGDAIKTENSDISDKGNQRGIVTINGGILNLFAACDGIDASYDVIINGGELTINTEKNSPYSGDVTSTSDSLIYIRLSSRTTLRNYNYGVLLIKEDGTSTYVAGKNANSGNYLYYSFGLTSNVKYVKFYAYSSGVTPTESASYLYASDQLAINTSADTYYINSVSGTRLIGSWTNYTTQSGGGFPGGGFPGGMEDGNTDKAEYSCKGIKADNSLIISDGVIIINSHDDALHANSDTLLETSLYGSGNITINGGTITINCDDDALHADGTLTINDGNIKITKSYEGVEGNFIIFNGGTTNITSSDDGINAKTNLNIKNGFIYFNAGGDGLDSNGTITMSGGIVLAIGPTNGGNGVIDYDRSFSFSGGLLLAIGASGMNQKPTATSGNTSSSKSISTNTNSYVNLTVNGEIIAVIKVVKSNQNYCVLAYNNTTYTGASVSVTTQNSKTLTDGLYYIK